jgi:hypothetical protein
MQQQDVTLLQWIVSASGGLSDCVLNVTGFFAEVHVHSNGFSLWYLRGESWGSDTRTLRCVRKEFHGHQSHRTWTLAIIFFSDILRIECFIKSANNPGAENLHPMRDWSHLNGNFIQNSQQYCISYVWSLWYYGTSYETCFVQQTNFPSM